MRVLLADGHARARRALRMFIAEVPGLRIVGEVSEADTLLREALILQPDVILLDWELRGLPAGKLISALRGLNLSARVIVLSWRAESERGALAAGADGFVSKASGPEPLLAVLRRTTDEERDGA
jgi:DNA-binding NarL/FixJ family response regulator